ncbi:hypothetical protein BST28_18905 [Mycolicibacter kumamotonensis]|uniref:Scaffolding protein n=1 Tax=Mycolicibacter kumamotonensis TaxID=354243 RepID=A0A1X0DY67_9MYCO|nr:hypothetical protein [Mycolicibacter kumamotonensis]ORA77189.1 hypothetical protein BST28_18905 [Mycolicibacter kumamotonensis]
MADTVSSDTQVESTADTVTESTDTATTETSASTATDGLSSDERAELDRLRAIHKDERRWEKRAKDNYNDAQKFRDLLSALGGDTKTENFDPKAELAQLRSEIESANTERQRAEVARVKNVDPIYVVGKTQEEMEAAAERYLADVNAKVQAALKQTTAPVTESTSTVTSGDRVEGPKQLTEAELRKLTPSQQLAAYKEGRVDKLLGR